MYNTSQCSRGIPNKSDSEQKYDNFYYSSPKAATDMGVSSSESHDLTAFYEMESASFGVLSQITGFYPSLDRIVETTLGPLNLGSGGGSYNELISHLHRPCPGCWNGRDGVNGISVHCKTHLQVPDSRVQVWSQQSCLRRDKIQYFGKVLQNSPLTSHKMRLNRAILTMTLPCQ